MDKERLVNFVATIMEDSGFKVIKNYNVADHVIDVYGVLNTSNGEVGVVVACKNYEDPWTIGLDIIKEMETAAKLVKASKIIIFTTSRYTHGAAVYAQRRNIKLVDRKGLLKIAKNYSQKQRVITEDYDYPEEDDVTEYYEPENTKRASLNPHSVNKTTQRTSHNPLSGRLNRNSGSTDYYNYNTNTPYHRTSNVSTRKINNPINISLDGVIDFFNNHNYVYLALLLILSTVIPFILNNVTSGPYTGIGKVLTCVILCYGGVTVINRDLSDILVKGSILFFISMFLSIITATM